MHFLRQPKSDSICAFSLLVLELLLRSKSSSLIYRKAHAGTCNFVQLVVSVFAYKTVDLCVQSFN